MSKHSTIRVSVAATRWQDHDDVLAAVVAELIESVSKTLAEYDTAPRWEGGDDGAREAVLVDIPHSLQGYALAEGYDVVDGPDGAIEA